MSARTFVATASDGSQVLVIVDERGAHIATRAASWNTWSPPLAVTEEGRESA